MIFQNDTFQLGEESYETTFMFQVLKSAERWVSQMGWLNTPNPVVIPTTITDTVIIKKDKVRSRFFRKALICFLI